MQDRAKVSRKRRASGAKQNLYVVPIKGGWAIKTGAGKYPSRVYATQAQAEKAATESLRRNGSGMLRIEGRDGRIRESFVLSRGDFEKISAVEGLSLSSGMKRDFDKLDRRGQSDVQRRKTILRKYAKQGV
ncbi:MAG: DUF2188 domain-containing protein [Hyphomicrobiales bacterium]